MGGCWQRDPPKDLFVQKDSEPDLSKRTLTPCTIAVGKRPLWDHRHHVAVSKQNNFLHSTHKEFFDVPQAFDYKTKPRTPLEPSRSEVRRWKTSRSSSLTSHGRRSLEARAGL